MNTCMYYTYEYIFSLCFKCEDWHRRLRRRERRRGVVCSGRSECSRLRGSLQSHTRKRNVVRGDIHAEWRVRSLPAGGSHEALAVAVVVREREQFGPDRQCARGQRVANECSRGTSRAARRPLSTASALLSLPAQRR